MSDLVLTDHPALDALEREIASAILASADEAGAQTGVFTGKSSGFHGVK